MSPPPEFLILQEEDGLWRSAHLISSEIKIMTLEDHCSLPSDMCFGGSLSLCLPYCSPREILLCVTIHLCIQNLRF